MKTEACGWSLVVLAVKASLVLPVQAGLYGDLPDATHAWSVHDSNLFNPVKVSPGAEDRLPPSDAIVLFDGTAESLARNWCDGTGAATKWTYMPDLKAFGLPEQTKSGYSTGAGPIRTRESFADCQLHLEFRYPADITGRGQMRGNSGLFLMNLYEIQLTESFETDPAAMKNPNCADGQCAAVYGQAAPLVNACRRPGEWQSYDLVFHAPVWKGGKLAHPASLTLFHNGVLVQDHWEMDGPTCHRVRARQEKGETAKGQLMLQDHGCPVAFRNVWCRPLTSRWSRTTHGDALANAADVWAQRRQTAERLFAAIPKSKALAGWDFHRLAEVYAYAPEGRYAEAWNAQVRGLLDRIAAVDEMTLKAMKGDLLPVESALDVLIRCKVIEPTFPLKLKIAELKRRFGW